jgi:hypothetical protein
MHFFEFLSSLFWLLSFSIGDSFVGVFFFFFFCLGGFFVFL